MNDDDLLPPRDVHVDHMSDGHVWFWGGAVDLKLTPRDATTLGVELIQQAVLAADALDAKERGGEHMNDDDLVDGPPSLPPSPLLKAEEEEQEEEEEREILLKMIAADAAIDMAVIAAAASYMEREIFLHRCSEAWGRYEEALADGMRERRQERTGKVES